MHVSTFSFAENCHDINKDWLYGNYYIQDGLKYEDSQGDYSLLASSVITIESIQSQLFGKDISHILDQYYSRGGEYEDLFEYQTINTLEGAEPSSFSEDDINKNKNIEGDLKPIVENEFLNMIKQIIYEESKNGITPKVGKVHRFGRCAEKYYLREYPYFKISSKLLMALARGVTARFMVTGRELLLERYILSFGKAEVTPEMIIRESYILNDGDFYLTILTIENILSKDWRKHRVRENFAVNKRLKRIINHFGDNADDYGSWYHFFGILLYSYVEGSFKAQIIARTESIGGSILAKREEPQEEHINLTGAKLGAQIKKMILSKAYTHFSPSSHYLKFENYTNLTEDFRGRLNYNQSDMYEAYVEKQGENRYFLYIRALKQDAYDCQIEVMAKMHGERFFESKKIEFSNKNLSTKSPLKLRIQRGNSHRIFISNCE